MVSAWRKHRGWNHAELADKLGVSRPCVAQWEVGRTSPTEAHIRELAGVFGVSVSLFYLGPVRAAKAAAP